MYSDLPSIGVGLGWRLEISEQIKAHRQHIDWCEVITEHYINVTADKLDQILNLVRFFPVVPHGVDLSIGTDSPIEDQYLDGLTILTERIAAPWFTDHLCFTRVSGYNMGQLTPLQFSEEAADIVVRKARQIKERIKKPFLLENITYYFKIPFGELSEPEFITNVLEKADIGLLLDVCNLHLNSLNHGYDPYQFLRSIPLDRVVQLHIAGGHQMQHNKKWIDSHSFPVPDEVFQLVEFIVAHAPVKAILLERDDNFPVSFQELVDDLTRARQIFARQNGHAHRSISGRVFGIG